MKAEEFGKYIKTLRKNKKMTIRQLELYSGVSNSYLSLLENGKRGIPSPEILKKLCTPLGIPYDELMEKAGYINEDSVELNKLSKPDIKKLLESEEPTYDGIELTEEQRKMFIDLFRVIMNRELNDD